MENENEYHISVNPNLGISIYGNSNNVGIGSFRSIHRGSGKVENLTTDRLPPLPDSSSIVLVMNGLWSRRVAMANNL